MSDKTEQEPGTDLHRALFDVNRAFDRLQAVMRHESSESIAAVARQLAEACERYERCAREIAELR